MGLMKRHDHIGFCNSGGIGDSLSIIIIQISVAFLAIEGKLPEQLLCQLPLILKTLQLAQITISQWNLQ
jgi:hypothetical protein